MFSKIVSTFLTKSIAGILSLGLVILAAQFLGAEGRGEISLLMLNITIIVLISEFVGGGALVYLLPRYNFYQLLIPSYLWAIVSAIAGALALTFLELSPSDLWIHLITISLLYCINGVHLNILLGLEQIKRHNLSSLVQIAGIVLSFFMFLIVFNKLEFQSYINAIYIGATSSMVVTGFFVFKSIRILPKQNSRIVFNKLISSGFMVQVGNVFQLLNYRFGYYLIEIFLGTISLGIYSTGVALAEALWLISKSISMVQYAKISNTDDLEYAKALTIKLVKFSFLSTGLLLVIICLLPEYCFLYLFGNEFGEIKLVIIALSPGVAAFSISGMFSHYLAGTGKFHINTRSSAIGFIITIIAGLVLIPEYRLMGAGIAATLSYIGTTIYQGICFCKITATKPLEFVPARGDFRLALSELRSYFLEK